MKKKRRWPGHSAFSYCYCPEGAISQARHRLVFVAPGVRQPVAKALAGAMSILPPEAIHLVLDVDAEVCRLGYGDTDLAGLTLLQQAASAHRLTVNRATRRSQQQGLQRIYFTQPEKFRASGIGATDFDRLSVAHGLSLGVETLMRITAKEASDRQWDPL